MGHLVRYSSSEGEERHEDVADLDAAVARAERLRNEEGVSDVRVYREVPLEFKTYVRVAVADDESTASRAGGAPRSGGNDGTASAPSGAAVISPPPASGSAPSEAGTQARDVEAVGHAEVDARTAENRRISLFNRGQVP